MRERLASFISGEVPMDIACIISSSPTAGGIEKARGAKYLPYGTLHSIIKKIGQQILGQIVSGKKSVKSLNFADLDDAGGRSFEKSGRFHLIEDNS